MERDAAGRYVGLTHFQPGLAAVVRETIKRSGYRPSATHLDRIVLYDASPMARGGASEPSVEDFLDALDPGAVAVVFCVREADLDDEKPFSPRQVRELLDALHAEFDDLTLPSSQHDLPTREIVAPPIEHGPDEGPATEVAGYSSAGVDLDLDGEETEREAGQVWLSLATEMAQMLPSWAALPTLPARAHAIAAWLEARLDDAQ
jgi:hypothetical protein